METLGHSQISLTMNTYSHVVEALARDAADRMDSLLHTRADLAGEGMRPTIATGWSGIRKR